jgi:3-hydroxybutyrate dehydrogenase
MASMLQADLTDRAALVTGAGSGIGRAIAIALSGAGAPVAVADLRDHAAEAVAREITAAGGRALALAGDVSRRADARRWVEATQERFGRLDILVNNAGIQHVAPIHEFDEDEWDRLIAVLLTGAFLATRYALPGMLEARWGRIVNIASAHGLIASPFKSAYVAAKHGVVGLTKVVALETAGTGITANSICPGYVRTPLVEGQLSDLARHAGVPEEEALARVVLPGIPMGRLLEPEEVAAAVLYLCSEAAAGMTGAALAIDGGWTAR